MRVSPKAYDINLVTPHNITLKVPNQCSLSTELETELMRQEWSPLPFEVAAQGKKVVFQWFAQVLLTGQICEIGKSWLLIPSFEGDSDEEQWLTMVHCPSCFLLSWKQVGPDSSKVNAIQRRPSWDAEMPKAWLDTALCNMDNSAWAGGWIFAALQMFLPTSAFIGGF